MTKHTHTMFRYLVQIETRNAHDEPFVIEAFLSRLTPLDKADYRKALQRYGRTYLDVVKVDITPIEDAEYRRRKAFQNKHED